mmetsp:Transcript_84491/g.257974  ORF Transcript_84491/g.257974 Transcript_84491/m.257974 type:complete len:374 (+) Transcript_84491:211-1332(+)
MQERVLARARDQRGVGVEALEGGAAVRGRAVFGVDRRADHEVLHVGAELEDAERAIGHVRRAGLRAGGVRRGHRLQHEGAAVQAGGVRELRQQLGRLSADGRVADQPVEAVELVGELVLEGEGLVELHGVHKVACAVLGEARAQHVRRHGGGCAPSCGAHRHAASSRHGDAQGLHVARQARMGEQAPADERAPLASDERHEQQRPAQTEGQHHCAKAAAPTAAVRLRGDVVLRSPALLPAGQEKGHVPDDRRCHQRQSRETERDDPDRLDGVHRGKARGVRVNECLLYGRIVNLSRPERSLDPAGDVHEAAAGEGRAHRPPDRVHRLGGRTVQRGFQRWHQALLREPRRRAAGVADRQAAEDAAVGEGAEGRP